MNCVKEKKIMWFVSQCKKIVYHKLVKLKLCQILTVEWTEYNVDHMKSVNNLYGENELILLYIHFMPIGYVEVNHPEIIGSFVQLPQRTQKTMNV